jgi:hypothetical protein
VVGGQRCEHGNAPHALGLLRARRERPACRRAAEQHEAVSHSLGPYAATLQIHLATTADVDQAGEISALRSMRGRRV